MDCYGIGIGIYSAARIYINNARGTGRTTQLVDSLNDGDRVIFTNAREAQRVKQMCLKKGVQITVKVVDPKYISGHVFDAPSDGKTIFDHTWVEQYYANALERARDDIDHLQTVLSGGRKLPVHPEMPKGVSWLGKLRG